MVFEHSVTHHPIPRSIRTPMARKRELRALNAARYRVPWWRRALMDIQEAPISWRNVIVGVFVAVWPFLLALVALGAGR